MVKKYLLHGKYNLLSVEDDQHGVTIYVYPTLYFVVEFHLNFDKNKIARF